MALNGTREGLFNACMRCARNGKGGKRTRRADAEPVLPGLCRRRARRGGGAGLCAATEATGDLPDYGALPRATCWTGRHRLYLLARQPAGRGGRPRLLGRPDRAGRAARFPIFADECYSEIYRDAPPPGALEAAEANGCRSRARGDFPFAVQAVEPARPALRLRRGRAGKHRAHQAVAQLCRRAAAPAAAGGRGTGVERRGPCRGKPRALSRRNTASPTR
jgi:hypothetical protein